MEHSFQPVIDDFRFLYVAQTREEMKSEMRNVNRTLKASMIGISLNCYLKHLLRSITVITVDDKIVSD